MTTKMNDRQNMPNGYVNKGGQSKGQTHYDSRDSIHTSEPNYMTTTKKALELHVCVNNDEFNSKKMTLQVNPHTTLDHFLQECTERIKPVFGAARRVYTPMGRHRVMDMKQLQKDQVYVIAGYETFNRHINYKEISQRHQRPLHNKKRSTDKSVVPVLHSDVYREKSGRCKYLNDTLRGLWLRVQVNGDGISPAHRVQVMHNQRGDLLAIKDVIKDSIPFLGVVERIYRVMNCGGCLENFDEILDAADLKTGDHLVAVPRSQTLRIVVYDPKGKSNMTVHTSPQNGKHYHFPSFHGSDSPNMYRHNKSWNKHRVLPDINKKSDSPYSSPGALGNNKYDKRNGRMSDRTDRTTDRPKKARNVDYDKDQGGVYRAKGQSHGHGAHQEQMDDNKARQSVDEFADDSFNRSYNNPPKANNNEPRSSTPARGDDARRKQDERQNEAAERIQASMKGHLKRQERKEMKLEQAKQQNDVKGDQMKDKNDAKKKQMTQDEAATKIQAGMKGYFARKEQNMKKQQVRSKEKLDKEREMNAAATKIQSGFKGHRARNDYKHKKSQMQNDEVKQQTSEVKSKGKNMTDDEAASKIQSGFKGYKARKDYKEKRNAQKQSEIKNSDKKESKTIVNTDKAKIVNENEAATKIQANFKGFKTRKEFAEKKKEKQKIAQEDAAKPKDAKKVNENEAATKIQANFKGFKTRKEFAEKKKEKQRKAQEDAAASKIQASFKGYQTRQNMKKPAKGGEPQLPDQAPANNTKDRDLDKAATKIQSGFRGYQARKDFKAKVIDVDVHESDVDQLPDSASSKIRENQLMCNNKMYRVTLIQSAFRGYHTRKLFRQEKAELLMAKNRIGAAFRGYQTRLDNKKNEKLMIEKENEAAIKIQSCYKGYRVRKEKIYPLRQVNFLHAAFRGYVTRKLNHIQTQAYQKVISVEGNEYYATIIQALCRGYMTRHSFTEANSRSDLHSAKSSQGPTDLWEPETKESYWEDTNIKMYSDKTLNKAATKIQACYRSYRTRQLHKKERKSDIGKHVNKSQAVTKVQASFRGFLERKKLILQTKGERVGAEEKLVPEKYLERIEREQHGSAGERSERVSEGESQEQSISNVKDDNIPKQSSEEGMTVVNSPIERVRSAGSVSPHRRAKKRDHSGKQIRNVDNDAENDKETIEDQDIDENPSDKSNVRSSTTLSGTATSVKSETIMNLSEVKADKVRSAGTSKSNRTAFTGLSSVTIYSSGCEVEKEGESLKEIEDDAGELSSIEKNVNAVSQLQAAFRAYRMRREVSELLSGGGELIDIIKIDRAVSALRKDFKLRSGKARRYGSYQFDKEKSVGQQWWESEENGDAPKKMIVATTIQSAFRSYHYRTHMKDNVNKDVEEKEALASIMKIEAAYRGFKTRKIDYELQLKSMEIAQTESDARMKKAYSVFHASFRGYQTRKKMAEKIRAKKTIAAAFRGYKTRNSERKRIAKHELVRQSATHLQAAFAGYLQRKSFISLTKMVSQQSDDQPSGLERMGSLSETDDFKLRHKTIAKIQAAFQANKIQAISLNNAERKSKVMDVKKKFDKKDISVGQLPLIAHTLNFRIDRPKSGYVARNLEICSVRNKSKTLPDIYGHTDKKRAMSGIEKYIKKKMALLTLQSHAKGFLTRKRSDVGKSFNCKSPTEEKRTTSRSTSRVSFKSKDSKESTNRAKGELTEMLRVRTASVKKEAERRKIMAEKIKLEQDSNRENEDEGEEIPEYLVRVRTASVKLEAGRRKAIAERMSKASSDSAASTDAQTERQTSPKRLTPIDSDRTDKRSENLKIKQESAIKIQKVYRGHLVRKNMENERKRRLDDEYEIWKHKRIQAAIAIQSGWRGYQSRRELQTLENEREKSLSDEMHVLVPVPRESEEEEEEEEVEKGILIINIGRTKSEIERANQRYSNATMLQRVFRASKLRQRINMKAARNRNRTNNAVTALQAFFHGYLARKRHIQKRSISRIRAATLGFLRRTNMKKIEEERRIQQEKETQKAATILQACIRSHLKRTEFEAAMEAKRKQEELNKAVLDIQCGFRGFAVREELCEKMFGERRDAVDKIHSSIKGHKQRQEFAKKKQAKTIITAALGSYSQRLLIRKKIEAAHRIQAGFNSYMSRKDVKERKERLAFENKTADYIHASIRGYRIRQNHKTETGKRKSAAIKIQSLYRGHKGRQIANHERNIKSVNNEARAIIEEIIDRAFGYLTRRSNSADRILAAIQGYNVRRRMMGDLKDKAVERAGQRREAAKVIRDVIRAKHGRDILEARRLLKVQTESAVMIQSLYRGYSVRKEMARQRALIAKIKPPLSGIWARTRSGRLLNLVLDDVLMDNARAIIQLHQRSTELQGAFRAYKMRREIMKRLDLKVKATEQTPRMSSSFRRWSEEDKAAIMIQKTFRGYSDRKMYGRLVSERKKLLEQAASCIQASARGYIVRYEENLRRKSLTDLLREESLKRKREVADLIACAFRGMKEKRMKMAMRVEM